MKNFRKKKQRWLVLFLLCCSISIEFDRPTRSQIISNFDPQIAKQIGNCVPNQPSGLIAKIELVSQTEIDSKTYFYFYAYDTPNSPYPSNLIISVKAKSCSLEHFNPMNNPIPLAKTVPQQVARNLVLGRYENEIKKIGFQGLQERVNSWASQSENYSLWDEEEWALQQLNIQIPAVLKK